MRKFFLMILIIFLIATLFPPFLDASILLSSCSLPGYRHGKWTVMFYFDGDQSETVYSLSDKMFADLENLKTVGSTDNVNLIVLLDGDHSNDSHLYYVRRGTADEIPLSAVNSSWDNEINMGDGNTLFDFINWSIKNYPAEHYNLYLNNHGGGWYGICVDEHPKYDTLSLVELKNVFTRIGKSIDVLSMDACLMGMVEVAYQLRGYVDYLVASESFIHTHKINNELFLNWRVDEIYHELVENPSMTAEELCIESVRYFRSDKAFILPPSIIRPQAVDCIGAIDISMVDDVVASVDNLSKYLITKQPFCKFLLSLVFLKAQKFSGGFDFLGYTFYPYIDLYDFCEKIKNTIPDNKIKVFSKEVMGYVEKAVIMERHGKYSFKGEHPNAHGLSVYLPFRKINYNKKYELLDFAIDTHWDEFLINQW